MTESLRLFMQAKGDGVFAIGHASALVRIKSKLYLFDPVWNCNPYGDYWTFDPPQINCDEILSQVDGVFISHIHEDHVCDAILKKIPRQCRIHVMDGREKLIERLLDSGRIIEDYRPMKWHRLTDDIAIFFVPHAFNSIDSSVFISSGDYTVYVGSDNFLDENLLNQLEPWLTAVKIDVALLPYAFIHFYPHQLVGVTPEERLSEISRLNEQSLQQAELFIKTLKPDVVIPFGASLFYIEGHDSPLNKYLVSPHELSRPTILEAGDFMLHHTAVHFAGTPRATNWRQLPVINLAVEMDIADDGFDLNRLQKKVGRSKNRVSDHMLIINNIQIDLHSLMVSVGATTSNKPFTRFWVDDKEFRQWLAGKITFEQVIGTRRFLYLRVPNKYNLEVQEWFMNNI